MQKFTHWLKENKNWLENEEPEQWVVVFKNGPKAPEAGKETLAYLPFIQGTDTCEGLWKTAQHIAGTRIPQRIQSMDGKLIMTGQGVVKADRPLPNYT